MTDLLQAERDGSDVSTDALSRLLYGGSSRLARLRAVWARVEADPVFDKSRRPHLNHVERYVDACRKVRRFGEIVAETRAAAGRELTLDEIYELYLPIDENLPLDVHLSMFIPLMELHTDAEQRQRWLEKSLRFEMIGAYAQTELAHGSNVRGIETLATFLPQEDAFDLHSPTLTSTKWWPGGLGKTCTHAVVYANLVIAGKSHGPHPFMVHIRKEGDHSLCPGIEVGDIGPKLGYNSMDNGYARFTHVKVPRRDMLRGFAKVTRDGRYQQRSPGAAKIAYGIMLDVRCRIVSNSAYVLARALTIAIRYSCVRLQGGTSRGREVAVLEYPTQQRILMPLLALAFALHFTGETVRAQYDAYLHASSSPKDQAKALGLLADLHCTTAALKALVTIRVSDGMESARKSCGGHGFLSNAGFGELLTSYLPFCTLEGTREVLGQQGGRHLVKCLAAPAAAPVGSATNTAHLHAKRDKKQLAKALDKLITAKCDGESLSVLVEAFEARAAFIASASARTVADASAVKGKGNVEWLEQALVESGVELVAASEAHAELLLLRGFYQGLKRCKDEPHAPTLRQLHSLARLFALSLIEQHAGQFLAAKILDPSTLPALSTALRLGCKELRPHAVALVEGWAFSDKRLGSTLGRSDGLYAEALYAEAKAEPLNANHDGFRSHLRFVVGGSGDAGVPFARARL